MVLTWQQNFSNEQISEKFDAYIHVRIIIKYHISHLGQLQSSSCSIQRIEIWNLRQLELVC